MDLHPVTPNIEPPSMENIGRLLAVVIIAALLIAIYRALPKWTLVTIVVFVVLIIVGALAV